MLRLDLSNKEKWLDLGHGVKVKVRPMTTPLMLQAQNARGAVDGARETPAEQTVYFAASLAKLAITDWSGVGGEDGKAAAVTPEGIDALMLVFPIFTAFQRLYITPGLMLVAEKKTHLRPRRMALRRGRGVLQGVRKRLRRLSGQTKRAANA